MQPRGTKATHDTRFRNGSPRLFLCSYSSSYSTIRGTVKSRHCGASTVLGAMSFDVCTWISLVADVNLYLYILAFTFTCDTVATTCRGTVGNVFGHFVSFIVPGICTPAYFVAKFLSMSRGADDSIDDVLTIYVVVPGCLVLSNTLVAVLAFVVLAFPYSCPVCVCSYFPQLM